MFQCNCELVPDAPIAVKRNLISVPAPVSGVAPKQETFRRPGVEVLTTGMKLSLMVPTTVTAGFCGVSTAWL